MENLEYFNNEVKCPFHSQQKDSSDKDSQENANTGDWDNERDDAETDPNRYEEDKYEQGGPYLLETNLISEDVAVCIQSVVDDFVQSKIK